jgi:hypothetical protein
MSPITGNVGSVKSSKGSVDGRGVENGAVVKMAGSVVGATVVSGVTMMGATVVVVVVVVVFPLLLETLSISF